MNVLPEKIYSYLNEELHSLNIITYDVIDSTNSEAKRLAYNDYPEFTTIIANKQLNGRGRLGRNFFSPNKTGLYMSIILRPNIDLNTATLITTASSVAVCKAIENITSLKPLIKWVNDIYIDNKKVCGILVEANSDINTGKLDSIILGIGVNVSTKSSDFPDALKNIATSLSTENEIDKNILIAEILNNFHNIYTHLLSNSFIEYYKSHSYVLNKEIYYIKNDTKYYGIATDISDTGGLIVKKDDGSTEILTSGEITVRLN